MDPLTIIGLLLGGGSFLSSLFGGGGDEQTQTTTSETDSQKYRSPLLGAMEPSIISALLGNAQSLGGAGMPGGVSRFGSNANTMFSDVISLLSKECLRLWESIIIRQTKINLLAYARKSANLFLAQINIKIASANVGSGNRRLAWLIF